MWSSRAKKDLKTALRRDELLGRLKEAVEGGDNEQTFLVVFNLSTEGHLKNDAVMPWALDGALEAVARRDLETAQRLSIYLTNITQDKDLRMSVTRKGLSLMEQSASTDPKFVAGVAMLSGQAVDVFPEGTADRTRALNLWNDALDVLSKTPAGMDFAFAAASNAALGGPQGSPFRGIGVERWEKLVTKLAETDVAAAKKEAERVANGYGSFGLFAHNFRQKAAAALKEPLHQKATETLKKFNL